MQEYWLASFFTGSDVSGLIFSNLEILTCFLTAEHSEEIAHDGKPVQARGIFVCSCTRKPQNPFLLVTLF